MLLLSMDGRDYALIAYGYGNTAFTDYGKEYLEKQFLDDFSDDDWEHGCRDYLTTCADLLKQARSGQPLDRGARVSAVQALLVSLVLGFLLAWVICWIWKTIAAKKVAQASQAQAYLTREGLQITGRRDLYTHTTQTRRKIEKSGSSGGTSVDRDGFSGKSGKF